MILFIGLSASAQCVPDPQYTEPGVYPDSATGLAPGVVGQAYDELITIIVPLDTTIMVGPISLTLVFDSVVVTDWQGLPNGFTYSCHAPSNVFSPIDQCAFEGNTTGCISITGTPTQNEIGSHQQIITTQAYSTPDSPLGEPTETVVDYYYIHIIDSASAGITTITDSKFLVYPNPAKDVVTINGLNGIDVHSIVVTDMNGKVHATYTNTVSPSLDMDINHLNSGMYFIRVNYNGVSETIKFVKK